MAGKRNVGTGVGEAAMWLLFIALLVPAGVVGWAIGDSTSGGTKTVTVTAPKGAAQTTSEATTTEATTTEATTTGETSASTATAAAGGNAAAGKQLFAAQGCGSCHTFAAAGASGAVGPDLDTALAGDAKKAGQQLDAFVRESIVKPDAFVPSGFQAGVMPGSYGQSLSDSQVADLVAFLTQAGS